MDINQKKEPIESSRHPLWWATALLFFGLFVTSICLQYYKAEKLSKVQLEFEERLENLSGSMETQFSHALYGINGAVALNASLGKVEPKNFKDYFAALDLSADYAGVRAFGAIERFKNTGAPDSYLVKFAEPQQDFPIVAGHNLASEAVIAEAIERAIATGKPALSGVLPMLQNGQRTSSFLYMVPVFDKRASPQSSEARHAAINIIFYAQLNAHELLSKSEDAVSRSVDYEIYDGPQISAGHLIYASHKPLSALNNQTEPGNFSQRQFHDDDSVTIGGHTITLHAGSTPYFDTLEDSSDNERVIGFAGLYCLAHIVSASAH